MKEQYKPSKDEINKAENMMTEMTDEQKKMDDIREDAYLAGQKSKIFEQKKAMPENQLTKKDLQEAIRQELKLDRKKAAEVTNKLEEGKGELEKILNKIKRHKRFLWCDAFEHEICDFHILDYAYPGKDMIGLKIRRSHPSKDFTMLIPLKNLVSKDEDTVYNIIKRLLLNNKDAQIKE